MNRDLAALAIIFVVFAIIILRLISVMDLKLQTLERVREERSAQLEGTTFQPTPEATLLVDL
jgi:hypothetical protein